MANAIDAVIGLFWNDSRSERLQALLSNDAEIDSARNMICLDPLLHNWWGRGYIALEPVEKLARGTKVRLRFLRRTGFSVFDTVPLHTDPRDHLHLPSIPGSFSVRDFASGHPVLDGVEFDLMSEDPTVEVSYELLQLQWDLLRMTVLCGAAESADDPKWDPEADDPVYSAERLLEELRLEEEAGPAGGNGASTQG